MGALRALPPTSSFHGPALVRGTCSDSAGVACVTGRHAVRRPLQHELVRSIAISELLLVFPLQESARDERG